MPDAWTAHFEALRKGELSPQDWQAFSEGPRRRTQGLPPLEGRERQVMAEEYSRLRLACQLFLNGAADFETLAARQATFGHDYALLKMLAASAINLLDLPAPSLPVLEADGEFEVRVRGATFTVFGNGAVL